MSSDIHPDMPPRTRCEAISSTSSPRLTCHRVRSAVLRYPGFDHADLPADDPAYLIGLALSHIRRGKGLTGIVPDTITDRLQSHADKGNPACRLLLDWLVGRNRDLPGLSQPDPARLHSIETRPGRRMIRERRKAGPGSLKKRMSMKAQSPGPKTAIIAGKAEGRVYE